MNQSYRTYRISASQSLQWIWSLSFVFAMISGCHSSKEGNGLTDTRLHRKRQERAIRDYTHKLARLLEEEVVLSEVASHNAAYRDVPFREIYQRDQEWSNLEGVGSFVSSLLNSRCSTRLRSFIEQQDRVVSEIIVTGERGLNACISNKTSDFNQADEDWWQKAWENRDGEPTVGAEEYDDSARIEAVPVTLPVKLASGKVIGVCKAVLDISKLGSASSIEK